MNITWRFIRYVVIFILVMSLIIFSIEQEKYNSTKRQFESSECLVINNTYDVMDEKIHFFWELKEKHFIKSYFKEAYIGSSYVGDRILKQYPINEIHFCWYDIEEKELLWKNELKLPNNYIVSLIISSVVLGIYCTIYLYCFIMDYINDREDQKLSEIRMNRHIHRQSIRNNEIEDAIRIRAEQNIIK